MATGAARLITLFPFSAGPVSAGSFKSLLNLHLRAACDSAAGEELLAEDIQVA
jgi:hypothetical protein